MSVEIEQLLAKVSRFSQMKCKSIEKTLVIVFLRKFAIQPEIIQTLSVDINSENIQKVNV